MAYPTDSCYALGCRPGNKEGLDRIKEIRGLGSDHHFTLVCRDFAQFGQFVHLSNALFRQVKAATPGGYTFILPATKEVPRRLLHPRKKTVGVRIPDHLVTQALLAELGEPLVSSTLLLPDDRHRLLAGGARDSPPGHGRHLPVRIGGRPRASNLRISGSPPVRVRSP
ncbi:L-threonylcarbamoyladenylate synthase [Nonomuraea angiospora]|uniref:L-threonylcarbamoyladenylate synthase n=1 Tax=Nonomuraea angiospora TaxID=46172 RepID=UPI0029C9E308|nr:Sua5/YciO/YrdC/YwlC family protein [Nonomuraea angiospora]